MSFIRRRHPLRPLNRGTPGRAKPANGLSQGGSDTYLPGQGHAYAFESRGMEVVLKSMVRHNTLTRPARRLRGICWGVTHQPSQHSTPTSGYHRRVIFSSEGEHHSSTALTRQQTRRTKLFMSNTADSGTNLSNPLTRTFPPTQDKKERNQEKRPSF